MRRRVQPRTLMAVPVVAREMDGGWLYEGCGMDGGDVYAELSTRIRSRKSSRCGDVYNPVRNPAERKIAASVCAVDPLCC